MHPFEQVFATSEKNKKCVGCSLAKALKIMALARPRIRLCKSFTIPRANDGREIVLSSEMRRKFRPVSPSRSLKQQVFKCVLGKANVGPKIIQPDTTP